MNRQADGNAATKSEDTEHADNKHHVVQEEAQWRTNHEKNHWELMLLLLPTAAAAAAAGLTLLPVAVTAAAAAELPSRGRGQQWGEGGTSGQR
jgi:hypothetical protein